MQNKLLSLARQDIVAMSAYRSARSEAAKGSIWLDANESPWNDTQYNRYPEPQPSSLVANLSLIYGVKSAQILVTRGSDEGIDLLIRLFCQAGQDQIMLCPPTYGMYKVAATIQGAGIIEIPLLKAENFSLNVIDILQAWQPSIKLIFLCSPNNPTGNLLVTSDILLLCQKLHEKSIIVVDEAYIEFSLSDTLVKHIDDYPNLIVLRTLSKAYGLAGIRCGTTIANPCIIQLLKKIIAPYPISTPIIDIAYQQLCVGDVRKKIQIILQEREKLTAFLSKATFVKKTWESKANFILFEVLEKTKILETCLKNGIVIRDRSNEYNLSNCLRVTIGTPSENKFLMEILSNV
jgi:histidinol-phosphate aminotransferase